MSPESASDGSAPTVLHARVADVVVSAPDAGWHVGHVMTPSVPDSATARAARLEARLAVYAQYAAVVAEEAAAALAGDETRRAALIIERDAAAEHYTELREAGEHGGAGTFTDALTDALHEIRHQDAVDDALMRRMRALRDATTAWDPATALAAGQPPGPRIDIRF